VSPWTSEIFSSSVSRLTRPFACRWASAQEMAPVAGAPAARAAVAGACPARATVPGAAVTRARQAAAVTVMTVDRAACRSVVAYLILSVGGHGRHKRCHKGMGTEGLGPVIGRHRLYGAAPLSGDAQINGR
jgi:hypothetical protein